MLSRVHAIASQLMRGERQGHTLQTTALVNEAFVRLQKDRGVHWRPEPTFFRAVAETMRRVLVDHARHRMAAKRGGGVDASDQVRRPPRRVSLDVAELAAGDDPGQVLIVEDALAALADVDAGAAEVVRLRMYAGMTVAEVAVAMEVSERSVAREWSFARAWLFDRLSESEAP